MTLFKHPSLLLLLLLLIARPLFSQTKTDSLEAKFKAEKDPVKQCDIAATLISELYKSGSGSERPLDYFNFVIKNKFASPLAKARAYNSYGMISYYQNNIDSAQKYFNISLALSVKHNLSEQECRTLNNLGSIYYSNGLYEEALEYYQKGLKKETMLGMEEGEIISLNNIGYIYNTMGLFSNARNYFRKGLRNALYKGEATSEIFSYDGLGSAFYGEKNLDSALHYFIKEYNLALKLEDDISKMYSALSLAPIYKERKNFEKAETLLKETRTIAGKMESPEVLASCYASFYDLYSDTKNERLAKAYIDSAIALINFIHDPNLLKDFYKIKAETEFKKGNSDTAYVYLKKHITLKDSLYDTEMSKSLTELQTKFDVSQREKQIVLLKEKDKQKQIVIYFALAAGIVFAGIAIYIYKISRQRKKLNTLLETKNQEVTSQKHLIEEKNKEILDSIHYAKRIQTALLAHKEFIESNFKESFVLFKPKDIVSGDFYWATQFGDKFYLAVCDSTGHGVPGAFMSLLNIGFLSEAIKEKNITQPDEVFNYVRNRLVESISKDGQKDGMDGILICLDKKNNLITYAAAHNRPLLVRDHKIVELKADKMPVGQGERQDPFTLFTISGEPGDVLFIYTDGYADQFGGPKGKKFKYKQLDELLVQKSSLPVSEQLSILTDTFNAWKGELEQVDDVLIAGLKIS
jgi:serine phosphatase RsbU (regulator of sigma subunit)